MSRVKFKKKYRSRKLISADKKLLINEAITNVVNYFHYFNYSPNFKEIHQFLPVKITQKPLTNELRKLVLGGKLDLSSIIDSKLSILNSNYTLPGYSILFKRKKQYLAFSQKKLRKVSRAIWLFSRIPTFDMVGLSGSMTMNNAGKNDDIDLFIISSPNRVWTTRFVAIVICQLLGLRRARQSVNVRDRVCLNMFFDGRDLIIPAQKRNLYVAHEVLQMRVLFSRSDIYSLFIKTNDWVFEYFPNADSLLSRSITSHRRVVIQARLPRSLHSIAMTIGNEMEFLLKRLQLILINRHRTTELITDTQLWFFPSDIERKLRKAKVI